MIDAATSNPPPDWSVEMGDLLCPLCGYNLRGLFQGRCPECGFAFQWQELREAETTRHKYLFEHGSGHNIKTFWKTYWTTCRPRKFWHDLNPAQPICLRRLLSYWLVSILLLAGCLCGSKANDVIERARVNAQYHKQAMMGLIHYASPLTQTQIDAMWPTPRQLRFWNRVFFDSDYLFLGNRGRFDPNAMGWFYIFIAWPWITLASLLIFRVSMRKSKIKTIHLVRTVIYAGDFGLLLISVFLLVLWVDLHSPGVRLLLICIMLCFIVTTYRLEVASRKYLRVHLPLATVLASQVIALLFALVASAQIADFTRGI